ncbi:uncharacterized protein LOC142236287 [Haematobia irritans]|uniref:uncharacterized protein LOC142236287 n=1 Tax=Haematobia irritans TaxID=7368 RepID=UPI003F4FE5BB
MELIVLISVFSVCLGIPTQSDIQLNHPSPVNPSVLIEEKPIEKIILISDANEMVKYKPQISTPLYPTALPEENVQRRKFTISKRDIPVPLVAKHKHPEVLPATEVREDQNNATISVLNIVIHEPHSTNEQTDHTSNSEQVVTQHPLVRPKPVPVSELFARHHDGPETST